MPRPLRRPSSLCTPCATFLPFLLYISWICPPGVHSAIETRVRLPFCEKTEVLVCCAVSDLRPGWSVRAEEEECRLITDTFYSYSEAWPESIHTGLRVLSYLDWLETLFQNKGALPLCLGSFGHVYTAIALWCGRKLASLEEAIPIWTLDWFSCTQIANNPQQE